MPSRYIREGLLDSDALCRAGEKAEVLFVRLMLCADDYGRFDGRVSVICRRCWPLGEPTDPNELEVTERLTVLARQGLIVLYEVESKPYILIPKFKQRTRATKSKYPACATYPQDDGHMTDKGPTDAGHKAGIWRSPDGPPQAVSRSSSSITRSGSGAPVPEGTRAPRHAHPRETPMEARTRAQLAEQERMRQEASAPPPDFASRLPPSLRKTIDPPPHAHEGGDHGRENETLDS